MIKKVFVNLEWKVQDPLLLSKSSRKLTFLKNQVEEENSVAIQEDPNSVAVLQNSAVEEISVVDLQEDLEEEVQTELNTEKEGKKSSMLFAINAEKTAKCLSDHQVQNRSTVTNVILKAGLQV